MKDFRFTTILDVRPITLIKKIDCRGTLEVQDFSQYFLDNDSIVRSFCIKNISSDNTERGNHAHKLCTQILTVINGKVKIIVKDAKIGAFLEQLEYSFRDEGSLYIPPGIWTVLKMDKESIVNVLCSHSYDENDYVRDYKEFERLKNDF